MKKILITLIIIFTSTIFFAQTFEGGIIGGMSASQIDGDEAGGYRKLGLTLTGYATLKLNKTFSLSSGVGYITKGANSTPKKAYFRTTLHYAEIPLYVNIQPKFLGKFSVSLGVTYDYLISAKYDDGGYIQNADDMGLSRHDISHYFSINYNITDKLTLQFVDNYSFYPITRPVTPRCWTHNIILNRFIRNRQQTTCWFNNNLRVSLQYKILWGEE